MISFGPKPFVIDLYYRPGISFGKSEFERFHQEILDVAKSSLDEIPYYQCLTGDIKEYQRLVIAVARDPKGRMIGFCSAYLLDGGPGIGEILHLGLTCVRPDARGGGLTHKLTSKVIIGHLARSSWFAPIWISNVACVLSSLGNVGLYFEEVFPSPFMKKPTNEHLAIAKTIDEKFRWELFIDKEAKFNREKFVFEASVKGNMFQKEETDRRYRHREEWLNQYYASLMDFRNGDEVLQIGKVSFLAFPKHLARTLKRKWTPTEEFSTASV
jgi:GNAT superfamily N-acetyltransferase